MNETGSLKWRFDVSAFRLLGRDLITDRVTAVYELVKNCYDANATDVEVVLEQVSSLSSKSKIIIKDDGYGMSFEDIRDKWMVIGTSSKRRQPYSPLPFNRKCVGEKGIGRFAVDKLGDLVTIKTKKANTKSWLSVTINWADYFSGLEKKDIKLFTEVENLYKFIDAQNKDEHGTIIEITGIRETWVRSEIEQLFSEIGKIVSPLSNLSMPFNVKVIAPEFSINKTAVCNLEEFKLATFHFSLGYNKETNTQDSIIFDKSKKDFVINKIPINPYFGGIKLIFYYFNESARRKYHKQFPNDSIDGFDVYRDNILATPFVESNHDQDKKRDILGIDKRLWRDIFSRVGSREFIGIINITKEENPYIIDATNRQDFVDNRAYKEFKKFIITQLDAVQQYKVEVKSSKNSQTAAKLRDASSDMQQLIDTTNELIQSNPNLKPSLNLIIRQAKRTKTSVNKAIKQQKETEEEFTRKENIYLSIMSLQDYAIQIAHAVRTTLNQLRGRVFYFYRYYPDNKKEKFFKLYAKQIFEKMGVLTKVVSYMLNYSQSNLHPEEINIRDTFDNIMHDYDSIFKEKGIEYDEDFPKDNIVLITNKQFFRDILQNLTDNSIKAIQNTEKKKIRCSYRADKDKLSIFFSDTGVGVPKAEREQIFTLYYTTTENQGGAGVGLYIVRTRVESMKGTVKVIDSEFGNIGTTFLIEIPFKK